MCTCLMCPVEESSPPFCSQLATVLDQAAISIPVFSEEKKHPVILNMGINNGYKIQCNCHGITVIVFFVLSLLTGRLLDG